MKKYVTIILVLICCLFQSNAQTVFGPSTTVMENEVNVAEAIAIGDLDNNGFSDVIFITETDNIIGWYRNSGTGLFDRPEVISSVSGFTQDVKIADFNGDGDLDVVSSTQSGIFWYENDGNGNFGEEQLMYPTDGGFVFPVDIDNDGDIDLMFSTRFNAGHSKYIFLLTNDGDGNFGDGTPSSTIEVTGTAYGTLGISAADVDNDGDIDVLAASRDGTIPNPPYSKLTWYENDGSENFSNEKLIESGTNPGRIYVADIDNDGNVDVVSNDQLIDIDFDSDGLHWYKNDGNGNFNEKFAISTDKTWAITGSDFDNDNDIDIISVTYESLDLVWHENDGNGDFSSPRTFESVSRATYINPTDFNNDGNIDIVHTSGSYIEWFENDGNQEIGNSYPISRVIEPSMIGARDLDNDGDNDIISVSRGFGQISYYPNEGNGIFGLQEIIAQEVEDPRSVFEADLDNDGDLDIIYVSENDDKVAWYRNDGNGNFGSENSISSSAFGARYVHANDLDNDGDIDVVVCSSNFNSSKVFWYKNDGSGNFGEEQLITGNLANFYYVHSADLNGDGNIDIISASIQNSSIIWNENDGNGNFSQDKLIVDQTRSYTFSLTDLDNDGKIDIVIPSHNNDYLLALKNDGSGNFSLLDTIDNDIYRPWFVNTGDLDNDNDVDILCTSENGELIWYENDGSQNYGDAQVINIVDKPVGIFTCDLDGDNDFEILSGNLEFGEHEIFYHENLLGEEYTTISGQVFWDKNLDSIYNQEDEVLRGIKVKIQPEGSTFFTSGNGNFNAFTQEEGTSTIEIVTPYRRDCEGVNPFQPVLPSVQPFEFDYVPFLEIEQDFAFFARHDNCRDIEGTVFNDANQDGVFDEDEKGYQRIKVTSENNGSKFSNRSGSYKFNIPKDEEETIALSLNNNTSHGYCGSSSNGIISQTFPTSNGNYNIAADSNALDSLNFGVSVSNASNYEAGIYSLVVQQGGVAGELFASWIDFEVSGLIGQPCTLRIEHSPLIELFISSRTPTTQENEYVEWVFTSNEVNFETSIAMDWLLDSSAVEGDTLHWEATYECPPGVDDCPLNNSIVRDVVITSGPFRLTNEDVKMYSMRPEGVMPEFITNNVVLSYEILFKNPLNTIAYDVTIIDTLPDEFDLNSISMPFSSASDFDFTITNDGVLIWQIDDVNLSNANEDALNSYGYVQFNVKMNEGLAGGTVIPNKATVLYNGIEPTTTNEVIHRIDNSVNTINEALLESNVSIFPNPFVDQSFFKLNNPIDFNYDIKLFDSLGKEVRKYSNVENQELIIKREKLPSGIYFLNIYESGTKNILGNYKLVVQ